MFEAKELRLRSISFVLGYTLSIFMYTSSSTLLPYLTYTQVRGCVEGRRCVRGALESCLPVVLGRREGGRNGSARTLTMPFQQVNAETGSSFIAWCRLGSPRK
jgi:hypothetical protein